MSAIKYREKFKKNYFEEIAWQQNQLVCGIDEVGRGCLAGPVVTTAVILQPGTTHRMLKDSKLMDQEELKKAYDWLQDKCDYATAVVHNREIDVYNIYQATLRAMRRCIIQLFTQSSMLTKTILVDAMPLNLSNTVYETQEIYYFNFGEKKSSSIAAASIIAKVTRDTIMRNLDNHFPQYLLGKHKGYSTKEHQEAVKKYGKSILHRSSFVDGKTWASEQEHNLIINFPTNSSFREF